MGVRGEPGLDEGVGDGMVDLFRWGEDHQGERFEELRGVLRADLVGGGAFCGVGYEIV